jgi:hypothetical protein
VNAAERHNNEDWFWAVEHFDVQGQANFAHAGPHSKRRYARLQLFGDFDTIARFHRAVEFGRIYEYRRTNTYVWQINGAEAVTFWRSIEPYTSPETDKRVGWIVSENGFTRAKKKPVAS